MAIIISCEQVGRNWNVKKYTLKLTGLPLPGKPFFHLKFRHGLNITHRNSDQRPSE
jgi:hypothetical protein